MPTFPRIASPSIAVASEARLQEAAHELESFESAESPFPFAGKKGVLLRSSKQFLLAGCRGRFRSRVFSRASQREKGGFVEDLYAEGFGFGQLGSSFFSCDNVVGVFGSTGGDRSAALADFFSGFVAAQALHGASDDEGETG